MSAATLHPLLQRLLDGHGATRVDPGNLAAWSGVPGAHALYVAGDPQRFPEALDVAVVLPELAAAFGGRFDLGLADPAHEDALARRFGAQRRPSIVLLRDGAYLGTVAGMQDWSDFVAAIGPLLDGPTSRPPSVGIPVVGAEADAASACH